VNRQLEYFDMPQVRKVVSGAKKDNYTFASLVLGIVNTDAFRRQGAMMAKAAPTATSPKVTSQGTPDKLPVASAVKAAAARSGSAETTGSK